MMRLVANVVNIISIIILPWWGAVIVTLVFLVIFDFAEAIIYGLVLDILYGIPDSVFTHYKFTLFALVIYAVSVWIRPNFKAV